MKKVYRNEADVKGSVKAILKEYGAWYFMPMTGGYGKSGVPDFCCVYKGYPVFIETKHGNKKPTPLQCLQMEKIYDSGSPVFVINEDNLNVLNDLFLTLSMGAIEVAMYNSIVNLKKYGMFKEEKDVG